jgi:hypothetical protein
MGVSMVDLFEAFDAEGTRGIGWSAQAAIEDALAFRPALSGLNTRRITVQDAKAFAERDERTLLRALMRECDVKESRLSFFEKAGFVTVRRDRPVYDYDLTAKGCALLAACEDLTDQEREVMRVSQEHKS